LRKVETASPLLVAGSSRMVVKLSLAVKLLPLGLVRNPPDVAKTGASLTAVTLMVKSLETVLSFGSTPLPLSVRVEVTVEIPN
jgi:hypothetical protein